ncbi:hypothetical protein TIFTF001_016831 [Ficus carica]|uniref:Uncharacterized protein n=1 Tax=Ficus carica TaxID=3494 RepID=A0AA88A703_FICCA|nr:hypothetical protein TIFTF001_016831 [Ficus carica]
MTPPVFTSVLSKYGNFYRNIGENVDFSILAHIFQATNTLGLLFLYRRRRFVHCPTAGVPPLQPFIFLPASPDRKESRACSLAPSSLRLSSERFRSRVWETSRQPRVSVRHASANQVRVDLCTRMYTCPSVSSFFHPVVFSHESIGPHRCNVYFPAAIPPSPRGWAQLSSQQLIQPRAAAAKEKKEGKKKKKGQKEWGVGSVGG